MSIQSFRPSTWAWLCFLVFISSCNGQVKNTAASIEKTEEPASSLLLPRPIGPNTEAAIGCAIQDKSGNIWFGSNGEGVHKFDGKSFVNYRTEQGLDQNIVYSMLEDNLGNIWVGTKKGLNRHSPSKQKPGEKTFQTINIQTKVSPINPARRNGVWSMMQDKKGTIWLGTDDGVYCYKNGVFAHFLDRKNLVNKDSLQLKGIFSIIEDASGKIWFASCASEGISCLDGNVLSNVIPHPRIRRTDRIIEGKNGDLWFAAVFSGLCRYDGKTFTHNIFHEKENRGPFNVLEDKTGNIWFDTQEGMAVYDGKAFKLLSEKDGFTAKNISPILLDKDGNLWFKSVGMGLYRYNGHEFSTFSQPKSITTMFR